MGSAKAIPSTQLLEILMLLLWKQEKYQINITVDRITEELKEVKGGLYFVGRT